MTERPESRLFEWLDEFTEALLIEDAPRGDLTTDALGLCGRRGRIEFSARGAMVVAGIELAAAILGRRGAVVTLARRSGDQVEKGAALLAGAGDAADLLLAWKASQTLVEMLSGIATATRAIVDAVEAVDRDVRVACTCKTFPGGGVSRISPSGRAGRSFIAPACPRRSSSSANTARSWTASLLRRSTGGCVARRRK